MIHSVYFSSNIGHENNKIWNLFLFSLVTLYFRTNCEERCLHHQKVYNYREAYEKRYLTKPFHRLSEFSVGYENDTGLVVAETMAHQIAISLVGSQSRLAYHISTLRRAE
jgi:hypothetical protein